jgi:plastocyanin
MIVVGTTYFTADPAGRVKMKGAFVCLMVAGLALTSCGSSDGPPTGNPPTGSVTGTATEGGTGIAGGSVVASRSGSANRTVTPTAAGYTIANLAVGQWSLAYTPPTTHVLADGEDGSRTVTIADGQTTTATAFLLAPAPISGVVEIHLSGTSFLNGTITIPPGTTVRWINDGTDTHTVTPENTSQPGVWQRATTSSQGLVLEHTFNVANQVYRYRCEPHSTSFTSGMVGVITVTG